MYEFVETETLKKINETLIIKIEHYLDEEENSIYNVSLEVTKSIIESETIDLFESYNLKECYKEYDKYIFIINQTIKSIKGE